MTVEQFIELMKAHRVDSFFHFTDTRNLDSIRRHGLLSMKELKAAGIKPITGGNDWSLEADAHAGMDAFVHLCFVPDHPMEYIARKEKRIEQSKFIRVSPEILRIDGVRLTTDVSNKSGIMPLPVDEGLALLDHKAMYTRLNFKDPEQLARRQAAEKYEILVPDRVTADLLIGL